jgi:class 3 adenylate cyclase
MNKFSDNKSQLPLLSLSVKDDTSNISHVNLPHQSSIVHFQANSPGYTNNNNTINNPQKKEEKQNPSFTADDYYKQEKQYLEKNEKSINKLILTKINHKNIIVIVSVCFIYPLTDGNCFQKQHNHTYNSIASVLDNVILSDKDDFEIFTTDFNEVFESYLNEVTSYYYPILNITKPHPHNINEQIVLYQNKTLNNKQYRIEEIGINIHKPKGSVIVFCLKQKTIMRSVIEICRTFYIIVLIYLLTSSINRVSSTLLLNPIEDMIKIIDIVSKDPVNSKTIDNLKKNVVGSIENIKKKKKNSDYEIKVIQFAIIRISALMAIGFGEAGGEILKENIQSSEGLNPMLEGKKIIAIFGFCYIRHFAEINEVLQEKTMIFVNRISEIVHSAVDKFGGITNKNLGDCFLLVWKCKDDKVEQFLNNDGLLAALDRSSHLLLNTNNKSYRPMSIEQEERRCFQSDCALLAFLSVIKKINKSRTILEYSNNKALKEKLGNNFKVQMGFGLHMGWAIEGAIGSFYKIDCSYLSPNVNITARLETATNIYGVDILFSGEFYDTLSTYMKQYCRKIDIVALKGCVTPVTLYTVDCNNNLKPGKPKLMNKKINFRDRRIKKQKLRNLYDKQTSKTIGEVYMSRSKGLRHLLKDSKSEAFLNYFDEGYTQYINGDWDEAYKEFKNALFLDNTDGPTRTLMNYIKRFNKVAPEDWDGFRKLESKT